MRIFSQLTLSVAPEKRDAAIKAYAERRVLAECAEVISGFISGDLLASTSKPDTLCVQCEWTDKEAIAEWMAHPVRAAQVADLGHFGVAQSSMVFALLDAS